LDAASVNDAEEELVTLAGPSVIVVIGGVVSTVHV
jgi:hypothetical protein